MAARKLTFRQLIAIAKRDRRFFNALIKNPRTALGKKGYTLSPADLRQLERGLRKVYRIKGKNLLQLLMKGNLWRPPWPANLPQWPRMRPWP